MSRRDVIIAELYESKELAEALRKMHPQELADDLKQEIFIALCGMPEDKLIEIHEKKQLKFYAVRIMLNMAHSKTSQFYYKYRKNEANTIKLRNNSPAESPIDEVRHMEIVSNILDELECLHWYEKDLFKLYMQSGRNASKVSRNTSIPKRSIYQTVKNVRDKIKKKIQL